MMRNVKGLLIVFEGTDGTGKSTQINLLATTLLKKRIDVISTFEPTNGQFGQQIRQLYVNRGNITREEELELFIKDRKEHVDSLLTPALASGKIILCDRYYLSTIAYQGAAGLSPAMILAKNEFAPKPDMALLFTAPVETSARRITEGRGEQLNDFEKKEYLIQVANQFERINLPYIQRINADRSIEAIHKDVLALTLALIKSR